MYGILTESPEIAGAVFVIGDTRGADVLVTLGGDAHRKQDKNENVYIGFHNEMNNNRLVRMVWKGNDTDSDS
jgi:hypothetical protein